MIKKIYYAFKNNFYWIRAVSDAAKADYLSAKKNLQKIIDYPAGKKAELELLLAMLDYHLEDFENSFFCIKAFRNRIELSQRHNKDEKNYLHCYADRILYGLKKVVDDSKIVPYLGDFTTLKKECVRKDIQLNFPLSLVTKDEISN